MSDSRELSSQPKVKISIVQKFGIFCLVPAFIVSTGLIIYDKKLADPTVIAVTGFIIFIIFLVTIYLVIRRVVKKQYEAFRKLQLMAITDDVTQLFKKITLIHYLKLNWLEQDVMTDLFATQLLKLMASKKFRKNMDTNLAMRFCKIPQKLSKTIYG